MSKALATKNVAAVLLGVALVVTFAFAFALPAKADTLSDLQAQVQALLAQISSLQGGQGGSQQMGGLKCITFTQNLKQGSSGGEVMALQKFLNSVDGTQIATVGAGSPGNESSYFGALTKASVIRFQDKFAADILTPVGLTKGTGNWFASTRAKANALCAGGMSTGGTTGGTTGGGTTAGGSLMISASTQPANSLAPAGASRVPFTTFMLTNTSNAAATVSGVTVQRTGLANDNIFSGVVLVDSTGAQIGVSRTFDSNHMTTVGDTMTINPGQSVTLTVAGNMVAAGSAIANASGGQVASIAVTGVNVSSGTVGGALPITGAMQTFNSTLTMGTVQTGVSSFDPSSSATKHIGDTAVKFSAVRFTAGSAEDVKFYSIRWRTNGSVSPSDLANVMTVVNGTSYPTTISADGRYYTSTFPGGVLLQKGNSADVYVQGDLVGSNSASRVVEFDLDKTSDVYFVGQTYGYGITPTLNGSCTTLLTGTTHNSCLSAASGGSAPLQPWFEGATVSIQGGTVTSLQNATGVASQNIATNVPNQVLGGFQTNFAGEAVSVQGMTFSIATSSTSGGPLTSVSIVDENGAVVAGPVDQSTGALTLVYTNSITFPTGSHTYTLKGRVSSTVNNGATYQLTVKPSTWTSPQGQLTGNTIAGITTLNDFTLNTMTVRGATLSVAASANPSAQNVVAGGQNIVLANLQFDASQSGEDIRLSTIFVSAQATSSALDSKLNNCQLWDGTTALTTGSNVNNTITSGTAAGGTSNTFTPDNSLVIPKGTVKTIALSCTVSSSANAANAIKFGVDGAVATLYTNAAVGVQSGNAFTPTVSTNSFSGLMTVSGGATVAVSVDSSSPSYQVGVAGTSGVTIGVIKLRATNEAFNLNKLGLTASSTVAANFGQYGSASTGSGGAASASGDIVTVHLVNSTGTEIGQVTFLGGNSTATSTLNSPLAVARDTDTLITLKVDLAQIGVSNSGGIGNLITVDPLNFEGTGASSGSTVRGAATGNTSGVRLFKAYPTLSLDTLGSSGVQDGILMRFKIAASNVGPVGIAQFNMDTATSTATLSNVQLFGFTDSARSQPVSNQGSGGQIGSTGTGVAHAVTFTPTTPVEIPAGQTYYFELRASVSGVTTGTSVVSKLLGDTAYGTTFTTGYNVQTVSQATGNSKNFIWSGNSTSTAATSDVDWSDGYSIPGLPSSGLIQTRSN